MEVKIEKLLMSKLRQPVHHTYISKYILKTTRELCEDILNKLVVDGRIEEVGDGYYVVK